MKKQDKISNLLTIVATSLSLLASIAYSWKIFIGESHPNISSWIVWAFLSIMNFTSYKEMTDDWKKSVLPTANSIMAIIILVCAIYTGSLKDLSVVDKVCLAIGVIAGLCWWKWKSANIAQVLLQISIIIGFIPTFVGVYNYPIHEPWLPWLLWALCFTVQFMLVKRTWKGNYIEFIYPVDMFICHGAVFILALQ